MAESVGHVELLFAQDDPADTLLMADELALHKVVNRLRVAHDVATALAHLTGTAPADRPGVPGLVLLDLNLPGRDGRTLLRLLRASPATATVPVVLLVDSPAAEQILRAENLPVQGYAAKPVDFERLVAIVKSFDDLGFSFCAPHDPPDRHSACGP